MQLPPSPFLYLVTPDFTDYSEQWVDLIRKAVFGGVRLVQIRAKNASSQAILKGSRAIHPFLKEHNVPMIINDRVDIAYTLGAEGVHLGQSDLKVSEARAMLGEKAIIGLSLENEEQVSGIEGADYVAISPLFYTQTKKDIATPWGIEGIKLLRKKTAKPIVVIGGIQLPHIPSILNAGADGIAVISAIANQDNPREAAQRFVVTMEQLKRKDAE